jgi:hypothetical protein
MRTLKETKSWTEIIGATTCSDAASIAAIEGTVLDSLCRLACLARQGDVKRSYNCDKLKNQA